MPDRVLARGTSVALFASRGLAIHKSITPEAQAGVYWTMVWVQEERLSHLRSLASIDTIVQWIRIHAGASMSMFGRCDPKTRTDQENK